jgi:polar amino acid transport system ATP-binding protein
LIIEELLSLCKPLLLTTALDLTLAYSEKQESVELLLESAGEAVNLIENKQLTDDSGLKLIRSMMQSIEYQRVNHKNRLTLILKETGS